MLALTFLTACAVTTGAAVFAAIGMTTHRTANRRLLPYVLSVGTVGALTVAVILLSV